MKVKAPAVAESPVTAENSSKIMVSTRATTESPTKTAATVESLEQIKAKAAMHMEASVQTQTSTKITSVAKENTEMREAMVQSIDPMVG